MESFVSETHFITRFGNARIAAKHEERASRARIHSSPHHCRGQGETRRLDDARIHDCGRPGNVSRDSSPQPGSVALSLGDQGRQRANMFDVSIHAVAGA